MSHLFVFVCLLVCFLWSLVLGKLLLSSVVIISTVLLSVSCPCVPAHVSLLRISVTMNSRFTYPGPQCLWTQVYTRGGKDRHCYPVPSPERHGVRGIDSLPLPPRIEYPTRTGNLRQGFTIDSKRNDKKDILPKK